MAKEKMTLGQFLESYRDDYDENSPDWELITMKNPEDPNFKKDIHIHKNHIIELKKLAETLNMPIEEMAFMAFMTGIKDADLLSEDGKQQVREFLNRQKKKVASETEKSLKESMNKLTVGELKETVSKIKGIKISKLDQMEKKWREEFREGKGEKIFEYSEKIDEDFYVKFKFAKELKR